MDTHRRNRPCVWRLSIQQLYPWGMSCQLCGRYCCRREYRCCCKRKQFCSLYRKLVCYVRWKDFTHLQHRCVRQRRRFPSRVWKRNRFRLQWSFYIFRSPHWNCWKLVCGKPWYMKNRKIFCWRFTQNNLLYEKLLLRIYLEPIAKQVTWKQ